ncbi:hypothetical protein CC80DRAFT_588073 [Byssothecium circinans]|uniref:Uncharacterized protein n=1 Tax=Byssothecium circinans TaxID=147558 RepID=A0A6A5UET4_9PLEO|nr:hypothetical protein CC80DRAFT_588073 [Byssothecium circinans]
MSPLSSFFLSLFLSTLSSVTALPLPSPDRRHVYKRSAYSPKDVGVGFGIAIGALISVLIVFYLGFQRGKAGSWLWWRKPVPTFEPAVKSMSSPTPSFTPTLGRRSTTNISGKTIAPSFRPSLGRSPTSLSGKTISTHTPMYSSTFTPSFSPVSEKPQEGSIQIVAERKFEEFGSHMQVEQVVHELGTTSPRRPASAWTATTAKSMTKSEWLRNTYMSSTSTKASRRKSFFTAYRKSGFTVASAKEIINSRPGLEERNTRGSFDDWRSDYAPSRRMTHITHRTSGSKSFFCSAAAEIEEQEREYAALAAQLQIQFKEQLSQETLVSPVSPMEPTSLPGSPPMPPSPTIPMPVVIRTSPTIDGSEWSYGSEDEDDGDEKGDEKEGARDFTLYTEKENYAEKEGEEEMDWQGLEWLRKVYNERRSRYQSGFQSVYIGES